MLLNSRGAIVTPVAARPGEIDEWLAPTDYLEKVPIPAITIDSTAIFDGHAHDLVRVSYSSGTALTFFVDSLPGGNDSSGDGSHRNPWRSLNTASKFLACASCVLTAACEYVQVKVKGTVDYVTGSWSPWNSSRKLILTGWNGVCDLGSTGVYHAGHIRDCKAASYFYGTTVHSGGTVYSAGPSATAIHAAIPSGGEVSLQTAVGCSGGAVYASYVSGGTFTRASVGQAVSINVSRTLSGYVSPYSAWGLIVSASGAAYRASVFVSGGSTDQANAVGVAGGGALIDCTVRAVASASGTSRITNATAQAVSSGRVVSGGIFTASAIAEGNGSDYHLCETYAGGIALLNGGVAYNVSTTLVASASAGITDMAASRAQAIDSETTANLGTSCTIFRARNYSSGVMYSSYVSSGGVC